MKDRRKEARQRLRRRRALAKQREREKSLREKAEMEQRGVVFAASPARDDLRASAGSGAKPSRKELEKERQRAIDALQHDVSELGRLAGPGDEAHADIVRIRREVEELKQEFYTNLGAWQKVQLARHPQRPYPEDFIRLLFENFSEIHGDRNFGDDPAMLAGMAWFHGKPVMVFGTQKGRDTKQRVARNFGQVKPEGYRKALRVMGLAAKFSRPILAFVDTPGAYPGVDAEERGQAEAIARNIREMSRLPVPIVVTVTGEGGSGGALAVAVGDRVFMLENSIYSVISPEGCASIMWRDSAKAEIAAEALKLTATDMLELKLVDAVVAEPEGGAHTDHAAAAKLLDPALSVAIEELGRYSPQQLIDLRYEKFRRMGRFFA